MLGHAACRLMYQQILGESLQAKGAACRKGRCSQRVCQAAMQRAYLCAAAAGKARGVS